jgi:hypothetical protein
MSVNPQMMQMLLAQQLMQPTQQAQPYGGGQAGPAMQPRPSPMGAMQPAAAAIQKAMLMKALMQRPPVPAPAVPGGQDLPQGMEGQSNLSGLNALA